MTEGSVRDLLGDEWRTIRELTGEDPRTPRYDAARLELNAMLRRGEAERRVRERAPRGKGDRSDRPKGVRYEWRRAQ